MLECTELLFSVGFQSLKDDLDWTLPQGSLIHTGRVPMRVNKARDREGLELEIGVKDSFFLFFFLTI